MTELLPHVWDTRDGLKSSPHPRHQHCTDKAQKGETVLSAVSYIYIFNIIIIIILVIIIICVHIHTFIHTYMMTFKLFFCPEGLGEAFQWCFFDYL